MTKALLTLNVGSSSIKFQVFELSTALPCLLKGKITGIGLHPTFEFSWQGEDPDEPTPLGASFDMEASLSFILDWLARHACWNLLGAAHRIVNGGSHDRAVELNTDLVQELTTFSALAPYHQPYSLSAVSALWRTEPKLRQFGCFDTAFHAHLGRLAREMALPDELTRLGLHRYGYHGLSYSWVAACLENDHPDLFSGRVVVAHLGSGASLCALRGGSSVDTTMGLTALDGLPMGTRCGSIDPGAILYAQQSLNFHVDDLATILYEKSGLLGLSGISGDVKALMKSSDPGAQFALDYFVNKTAQHVAAMTVSLGGIDALIFTGGIGENADSVRHDISIKLAHLGHFKVLVIPADEERAMAREVLHFLLD